MERKKDLKEKENSIEQVRTWLIPCLIHSFFYMMSCWGRIRLVSCGQTLYLYRTLITCSISSCANLCRECLEMVPLWRNELADIAPCIGWPAVSYIQSSKFNIIVKTMYIIKIPNNVWNWFIHSLT